MHGPPGNPFLLITHRLETAGLLLQILNKSVNPAVPSHAKIWNLVSVFLKKDRDRERERDY
jgi:hypothetical protein